jgi:hypothetical protein
VPLTRAHALGLSVLLTDPFYDIDVVAGLSQLADELQRMPQKAPRTVKWAFRVGKCEARIKDFYEEDSSDVPGLYPTP